MGWPVGDTVQIDNAILLHRSAHCRAAAHPGRGGEPGSLCSAEREKSNNGDVSAKSVLNRNVLFTNLSSKAWLGRNILSAASAPQRDRPPRYTGHGAAIWAMGLGSDLQCIATENSRATSIHTSVWFAHAKGSSELEGRLRGRMESV